MKYSKFRAKNLKIESRKWKIESFLGVTAFGGRVFRGSAFFFLNFAPHGGG